MTTTQIDVLNAQIANAQALITQVNTQAALRVAQLNKQIGDWQAQITQLSPPSG